MSDETTNISELLQSADNLIKSQHYSEALQILHAILILDPNNAVAWNAKGDALDGLKKYQEALDAYDKAISINPNLEQAWSDKGCVSCKIGKYNDALDACNQALSINPNFADGWTKKGCVLLKLGRYQEALEASNKALTIDPNSAKAKENSIAALNNIKISDKSPTLKARSDIKHNLWKYILFGAILAVILHQGINNQITPSQPTIPPTPTIDPNSFPDANFAATPNPQAIVTDSNTDNLKSEANSISQAIDYSNPIVRNFATSQVQKSSSGHFNIMQIGDVWDPIRAQWTYIGYPNQVMYYTPASESITVGLKGNCLDYAILNAAVIEAMGGNSRIIVTQDVQGNWHAYAEDYVSDNYANLQSITDYLRDRYGESPVYYHSYVDSSGDTEYWLNLDWQANYPGGPFFQDDGTYKIFYPNGAYDVIQNSESTVVVSTPSMQYVSASTTDAVPTATEPLLYAPTPTQVLLHEPVCTKTLGGVVCK
jgi:tetratricopeptide (TPR) repeat protein